ncbi:hypothetical protein H9P43_001447 [Blastocladiella emersonii ATCC 22665]|nr:hypothetical protein H9P43_001447 [Blastocladiella emersonii ATCC 22665]
MQSLRRGLTATPAAGSRFHLLHARFKSSKSAKARKKAAGKTRDKSTATPDHPAIRDARGVRDHPAVRDDADIRAYRAEKARALEKYTAAMEAKKADPSKNVLKSLTPKEIDLLIRPAPDGIKDERRRKIEAAMAKDQSDETWREDALLQPWSTVPAEKKYLGLACLPPFLVNAYSAYTCVPAAILSHQMMQATYGGSVLCFLGLCHRVVVEVYDDGEVQVTRPYIISVIPFLAGAASFFMQPDYALPVQMAGLGLLRGHLPPWFPTLRIVLTTVAVGALGVTWYADKRSPAQYDVVADIKEGLRVLEIE